MIMEKQLNDSIGINTIDFPICLINTDEYFTIAKANPSFYALLEYTEKEIQFKFKNSLSALIDVKAIHDLNDCFSSLDTLFFTLEHVFHKKNGDPIWVYSIVERVPNSNVAYLICINIEEYKASAKEFEVLKKRMFYIYNHLNFDVFEYNTQNNSIYIEQSHVFFPRKMNDKISLKELVEQEIVHPAYRKKFEHALQKISNDQIEVTMEILIQDKNEHYHYAKLSLGYLEQFGNHTVVGILMDIASEKEATSKYLNETRFYQAILSQQDAYGHMDVTLDKVVRVGGLWGGYNELINRVTFTELFGEFSNKVVHVEDREQYQDIMNCHNFTNSFNGGITYLESEFRRIVNQNKMEWMKLKIHLFKDPLTSHIMALIYLKNINEEKRRELSYTYSSENMIYNKAYDKNSTVSMITNYLNFINNDSLCAFAVLTFFKENQGMLTEKELKEIIHIIDGQIRLADIIGLVGENEMVIFFKDIGNKNDFEERLQQMLAIVQENQVIKTNFKLGISFVKHGQSYTIAYRQACIALYVAIDTNNTYNFYQEEFSEKEEGKEKYIEQQEIYIKTQDNKKSMDYLSTHTTDFDEFVGEYGDMAYLIDPETYDLLYANEAFYSRIGKVESQCMSMKCYEAVHQRTSPCPFCGKANWATDKFYIYRNYNESLEQEFLVKNRLVEWQGSRVVFALAIDISNDRTIVDSLENGTTENSYILSGIEHMQEAKTLEDSIYSALENIGQFFRAEAVRYWHFDKDTNAYQNYFTWTVENDAKRLAFDEEELETVREWVNNQKWDGEFTVDSQETMLCYSYEIYQIMVKHGINNHRWMPIDGAGVISIDNVSINFFNVSFMQTFSGFLISEFSKRDMLNRIIYTSSHDTLTNLLNRNSYEEYVSKYRGDEHHSIAVVASNVNGLKEINDGGGFDLGNHYLIQLSKLMQATFGKDNVYRLSGDDYIAVITDIPKGYVEEKIKELRVKIEGLHAFTVSFGYSWDNIEKDLAATVEYAAMTMRANKNYYYDTVKTNHDTKRLQSLNALLVSIKNHEFRVFLQPKYDNLLNKVVGAEALIRYYHEEYGIVPPGKFVEQLERDSLIRYIDIFVFEETCKLLQKWQDENKVLPVISLNLSRMTLAEQDLLENLEDIFSHYTIDKKYIELEITESYAEVGKTLIYQSAQKLHDAGYAISLDDFGTKYTNLTILSDISVDVLKIDKSLIHALVSNERNQVILKNIITMCNDLDVKVIAEGVETKQQEDMLKKLNCHLIQGYLYSKPISIDEFEQLFIVDK